MSFLTDLAHGNFSELGGDLTNHFKEEIPYYLGGAAALTGGLGLAGIGPAAGLFGGAEAAGAGLGADAGLGGLLGEGGSEAALGLAADNALGLSPEIAGSLASAGGETALGSVADVAAYPSSGVLGETSSLFGGGSGLAGGTGEVAASANGLGQAGEAAAPSFWDKLVSGAGSSLTKNPLGIAAAAGGLGLNMLKGNPNDPNRDLLKQKADQLGAQGQQFANYLAGGTLPPAMQAKLDQATSAAKARIIANHAKNGMSTDPSQNSALAQELNSVDINAVSAMADAQIKMMQQGLSETGLSTQLYEMLVKMDRQDNQDLMSAIANFASALGGGGAGKGQKGTISFG